MFSKVISIQGFWKSVFSLAIAFILLFVIVKWAIEGFKMEYFTAIQNPFATLLGLIVCGFIYGFLVTFGKFRAKIKKDEAKQ
jgi:NhaP-type Na+/H+ or K+/H+ antiporter